MKHISKARREADQVREKIKAMEAEREGWRLYEDQRDWLRKLLRRDEDYIFTENERKAVNRMAYMRTFFEGWAGYSVQELVLCARRNIALFLDSDVDFLNAIEHTTRLTRRDMDVLVGLCRTAEMDIPRFEFRGEMEAA